MSAPHESALGTGAALRGAGVGAGGRGSPEQRPCQCARPAAEPQNARRGRGPASTLQRDTDALRVWATEPVVSRGHRPHPASCGCCDREPQTGSFKDGSVLSVPEAGSLQPGCWPDCAPQRPALGWQPQRSLSRRRVTPTSCPVHEVPCSQKPGTGGYTVRQAHPRKRPARRVGAARGGGLS